MDLKTVTDTLEVVSDLSGFVSGLILLEPTSRLLAARHGLQEKRRALLASLKQPNPPKVDDLLVELGEAEDAMSAYDPTDRRRVLQGLGLLLFSFALKLAYHVITKMI